MTKLIALTVISTIGANCGTTARRETNLATPYASVRMASPSPSVVVNAHTDIANKNLPSEFTKVDFKNFSYPISLKHQTIQLKDGHLEFFEDQTFYNAWFDLDEVDYADLSGDGKKEAVVQLTWVSCGGSCDGGSSLFYFYRAGRRTPRLLTRIETGSLAYQECGLKTFNLDGGKLVLETFQTCRFDGISIKPARKSKAYDPIGKFAANTYTRFALLFAGNRFTLQNRKVFPWPQKDAMNYEPEVSIK